MCIPYHAYRNKETWGDKRKAIWQGACEYLDALREDVLPPFGNRERVVLLGDFNLQIPPAGYPGKNSVVNAKRIATFGGWKLPTANVQSDPALDKPFIDHVALSHDIILNSTEFFSRIHEDGTVRSDHNGVCIDVSLDFSYPCLLT